MERYPLEISEADLSRLKREKKKHIDNINELEALILPDYKPKHISLKDGYLAREYQIRGKDVFMKCRRLLCGDDLGLGKTLIAIISFLEPGTLPAIVTVQSHLTKQWKDEIEKFTDLKVHVIKGTKPYSLPPADVYITKYTCLAGWVDLFKSRFFKMAVFDEAQELRHNGTAKYNGAEALSESVDYCLGLTATPIYNYGVEIYNVLSLIKPECLGYRDDFLREWCSGYGSRTVFNPVALGTFLRDGFLLLRRTRAEVGRELPPINTIVHTVGHDEDEVHKADALARQLALKVTTGSFVERGQAARELDMLARQVTGVSKARGVAEYVKILLENNVAVILAGWHREVYSIWLEELAEYKPVMYTGSESPKQKEDSKQAFLKGETNLFIISLRSGVGLDGLQHRCNTVVVGELDWSPKVHDQLIARSDRDGQKEQVTAIFLVSDYGSDPVIIDLLGLKSSQSHNIIDPLKPVANKHTDESRIKILAQKYLEKKHHQKSEANAV
jgi:SNF2 family DNA or RNA helicase